MRGRNILAFAVSFLLAAAVLAQGSGEANAKKATKAAASNAVIIGDAPVARAARLTGARA